MTESGQFDLLDLLGSQTDAAQTTLTDIEDTLNPQIDANPNDKLLMEMLDIVTDAQESLNDLRDLIETARRRDQQEPEEL